MSRRARPLVALALAAGALATAGNATAYCSSGGVVPQAVCSRVPERVPQCWVDTYRKLVTCEYIQAESR
ncbi:MAG TPA: hypothetical protein VGX28_08905 [Frankiaceae bacterium]|jgi:hypothetical protein|nr:hypothetical protein [Frankiaceae bacterium]